MGHSFKYVGCFLKAEELYEKVRDVREGPLPIAVEHPHVTFQYRSHITLTVSREGEAVNTRELEFSEITPVRITGIYGGCTEEKEIILGNRNPRT